MQMINTGIRLGDSTKLQEFVALLNEVAVPKYFSNVELEDNLSDTTGSYALVKFYVDDELCMEFMERKSTLVGSLKIILPDKEYTISFNNNQSWIGHGTLLTDNAIVFYPCALYSDDILESFPFIICKTTDDKTMCMFLCGHADGTAIYSIATNSSSFTNSIGNIRLMQHVFGESSVNDNLIAWFGGSTTNTDGLTVASSLPTNSGHIAKDVYQALNRSPYTIDYPFLFTQNGVSYCGIAYNNYVIKTT